MEQHHPLAVGYVVVRDPFKQPNHDNLAVLHCIQYGTELYLLVFINIITQHVIMYV